jgi:hypothetical protein
VPWSFLFELKSQPLRSLPSSVLCLPPCSSLVL